MRTTIGFLIATLILTCGLACFLLAQVLGPLTGVIVGLAFFGGTWVFDWYFGPPLERWFRRRKQAPKSRTDGLYAAACEGEMPLDVLADHLTEAGDDLADGVRWLAEHRKRPEPDEAGEWRWYIAPEGEHHLDAAELPWYCFLDVFEREPIAFPTYRSAMESAARVVTRQVLPESPPPPRSQLAPSILQFVGLLGLTAGIVMLGSGSRPTFGLVVAILAGVTWFSGFHLSTHRLPSN